MEPPCFNNNQRVMKKRLFGRLIVGWVATGCIFILQAAHNPTQKEKSLACF
jgi:hypothetical protein